MADSRFDNHKYVCWLKVCMALIYAKEGLEKLTDELAKEFHSTLEGKLGVDKCSACSKDDLIKQWRTRIWLCKTNVCGKWLEEIRTHLSSTKTSIEWDNSDISCLPTSPWDCLKLYMPYGCKAVTEAEHCDIAAILTIFMNNSFFHNRIGGPLATNCLDKVKEVRNEVMHSSDMELDETKMDEYMDTIINILKFIQTIDQNCTGAIANIQQLQSTILEVSMRKENEQRSLNTRFEAMVEKFDEMHNTLMIKTEELKRSNNSTQNNVKTLQNELDKVKDEVDCMNRLSNFLTTNGIEGVDIRKIPEKEAALKTLAQEIDVMKSEISELKRKVEQIESGKAHKKKMRKQERIEDFQSRLLEIYNNHCSSVPVYALRPRRTHRVEDLYVAQTMCEIKSHASTEQQSGVSSNADTLRDQKESMIQTVKDIFFKEGKLCNNIYVTGEAGVGKSTFCVNLVDLWCKAQSGSESISSSDFETMRQFPLLFYIHLSGLKLNPRNDGDVYASIIEKQLGLDISVIKEVLQEGRCLIIADALDESVSGVPTRGKWNKSTILITSRPWKVEAQRHFIDGDAIDRHIQIVGIDQESAKTLVDKVVSILDEEHKSKSGKKAKVFIEEIKRKRLVTFLKVPVLLIQMVSLWYKGISIGNSNSSIYENLVHHQILAYVVQKNKGATSMLFDKYSPIRCKIEYCPCNTFRDIIIKVGKFAFDVLVSKQRESETVFSHYKREMHVETCLQIGILTQHKLSWELTEEPKKHVGFVHKTFQEYFASIYLAYEEPDIKKVMFSAIDNLDKMLELEKVIMFVSGLNPEMGRNMATLLLDAAEKDHRIKLYREKAWRSKHNELVSKVQNAILTANCECRSNNYLQPFCLFDIRVNHENLSAILSCLSNKPKIASIFMEGNFPNYITARSLISDSIIDPSRLEKVELLYCIISSDSIAQIVTLSLSALNLSYVRMSHTDLSSLCSKLEAAYNLRNVSLYKLECKTHGKLHEGGCGELRLNLSELHKMKELHIWSCEVSALILSHEMPNMQHVYFDRVTTTADIIWELVNSLPKKNVKVTLKYVTIRQEGDSPSLAATLERIRNFCTVVEKKEVRNENNNFYIESFVFDCVSTARDLV